MDFKHTDELCAAVKAGDAVRAKRAIEAGDSISSGRIWGVEKPPIVWAAITGNVDCVKLLIESGADVNVRASSGQTPLMWAVNKGNRDCISALLDSGADVNAYDDAGMTVAMWAAQAGANKDPSLIGLLVEAGADLRPTDSMRRTAATHAKLGGALEMSALIKSHIVAIGQAKKIVKAIKIKPSKDAASLRM